MPSPVRFRPEVQEHIDAGHFSITPKRWPNGFIWHIKRPDGSIITVKPRRSEAEEAALEWYREQAA